MVDLLETVYWLSGCHSRGLLGVKGDNDHSTKSDEHAAIVVNIAVVVFA